MGPLEALAQASGKYLLVTGTLTADQRFRLSKYFLQILAGITGAQVVVDPRGDLVIGPTHRIPIDIALADHGFDTILTSPLAEAIDFTLEAPDGTVLDPGAVASGAFVLRPDLAYYRLPLPHGGPGRPLHAGRWHALLRLDEKRLRKLLSDDVDRERVFRELRRGAVAYNLVAHAYSTLVMHARLSRAVVQPGETSSITAALTEYSVPVDRRAAVWAEVTSPDGSLSNVSLTEVGAGTFQAQIPTFSPGLYPLRIRARGTSLGGIPFTREAALSLVAQRGHPDPRPGDSDGVGGVPWDLLECLLGHAKEGFMGLSPEEIRKCLEMVRPRRNAAVLREPSGEIRQPLTALRQEMAQPDLRPDLRNLRLAEPPQPPEPVEDVHRHVEGEPMFGLSPQDLEEADRLRREEGEAPGEAPGEPPKPPRRRVRPRRGGDDDR
ncbi:hypothetical protein [Paracoccus niistensis]|uniref:DUF4388 domain-containing protein n=1 Tax=Paracoccus niistensis TaxID=632935 RepID=A0ABV6I4R6_9RHOB